MTAAQKKYLKNRDTILQRAKERHRKNLVSENYRAVRKLRNRIWDYKSRIERTRKQINSYKTQIQKLTVKLEIAELAWGKERAERKRNGKLL